jgi:DNA-binding transcriptional MerR regulator
MTTVLVRTAGLSLEGLARQTGLQPDLLRRFVSLGVVEPARTRDGELRFRQSDVARVCRAERLRSGLGLNYAALGLVLDLLDRIAALEARQEPRRGFPPRSGLS